MKWDDDRARTEYAWLRLMSRLKYDDYRDFLAGVRFIESLAQWLQQFTVQEREVAFAFVRNRIIYFGPAEMVHLVELVYPETVQPYLIRSVSDSLHIPVYRIWSTAEAVAAYQRLLRRTLFLGLSDGARIDIFRRANVGIVSNEQVAIASQIDQFKWADLLKDLRSAEGDGSKFAQVFLLDDFTASGASLLRPKTDRWTGKLERFWDSVRDHTDDYFEPDWHVTVHHYIGTTLAQSELEAREQQRREVQEPWLPPITFSFGTILPAEIVVTHERDPAFAGLIKRYYDPSVQTVHTDVGGTDDVRWGFGGCALPVVLEHNTPNNSVALLWAETEGSDERHAMRPLFRRRQRHV